MNNFDDVDIITNGPDAFVSSNSSPENLMAQGKAIQKIETGYHTAVAVQKPRKLGDIVEALDIEAQYGGEDFYYAWSVYDKKKGKKVPVEGCSVGAALAIAREFGNCAIPVEINETSDAFIFTASFVDIEKGFTVTRVYRHKKRAAVGKYDQDRYDDMEFQKGQSKAIRNVVLAGVPKWLSSRVKRKAKEAVIAGIGKEGLDVAKDKAVTFLKGHGVKKDAVEAAIGQKYTEWDADTVATLRVMCKQILDGESSPESLFPPVEQVGTEDIDQSTPFDKQEDKKEPAKEKTTGQSSTPSAAAQKIMDAADKFETKSEVDAYRSKPANRKAIDALGDEAAKVYAYLETVYSQLPDAIRGDK